MNSATRFAWTSSSSRNGSELRIVERISDQGAMPPWSSAAPTIWWAKTSRARRWTCNGSRSWSRAAWTAARGSIQLVARSSDPLDEGRDLPRRVVLDDLIDRPDVDPELEGGRRHEPFDVSAFESGLDALPFLAGEGAVVDGDVLSEHREARTEELGQRAGVHEDERGAALAERIVDRGEPGCRLRGDVEVSGGLEILVDRAGPLDAVFVLLLEGSHQDFERVLTSEQGRDGTRMADGRGEPDPLETAGDRTQALQSDGELDSSAIRRELMNFVDDDVFDVLQMTLHELSGQNRLERLGSRDEDVWRSCSLTPAFGRRGVAMAHC